MMPRALKTRLLAVSALVIGVAAVAVIGFKVLVPHGEAAVAAPAQWQFSTADGVRTASLQSRNSLKQPAPFKGGPATLSVARGPGGYAVRLDVDGDMACSYAPTASKVEVRFDDGPPRTFACAPAPDDHGRLLFDGAHSTAYLADPVAFLARLRNARHVRVASDFAGQTQSQVMAFDLPPVDPVAQVSSSVVPVAQMAAAVPVAPIPAAGPAAVTAAPLPAAAPAAAAGPVVHRPRPIRVAARRHPAGYYLHPYRPSAIRGWRRASY